MNNEGQDQEFHPPFSDPLSGITVTRAPAQGQGFQSWTPPPPAPDPQPPEQKPEESIEDILEMFRREAEETAKARAPEAAPEAPSPGGQGGAGGWTPPTPEEPVPHVTEESAPDVAPFQAPWMTGGDTPTPPPPQAEDAFGGAAQYTPPQYQAQPGAAPQYAQPPFQAQPGAASIDPTTTAAVAAAMAAVLTDIGRTRYGYQAGQGQGVAMGGGYAGGIENMMASIMAEASRISGQPVGASAPQEAQANVSDIVAEVQGWDTPRQSEAAAEPGAAGAQPVFTDPIQAEAARVQARSAPANDVQQAVSAADTAAEAPASTPPAPPGQAGERPDNKPPRTPPQDKNRAVRKSPKKRSKPKIAKDAKAKGMRGGLDLSKTSVNVAVQVKTMASPSRAIPLFLLVMVCIAAFCWFGVIQFMARADAEEDRLRIREQERDRLTLATADFNEVQRQYVLFGDTWMNETEQAQVDALDVLAVAESELLPAARVESVSMDHNLLSVNMSGVTLEATAGIVSRLEQLDIVKSVSVYTAASLENPDVVTQGGYTPEQTGEPGGETPVAEASAPVEGAPGSEKNTTVAMSIVLGLPDAEEEPQEPGESQTPGEEAVS